MLQNMMLKICCRKYSTVGYSVNTPGYRVWDPVSHKVWDVWGPDFDELVGGGWWKKPPAALKPK